MSNPNLYKIRFYDADVGYENLWAEKSSHQNDAYVIKSIPYFIYEISVDDVVKAITDEEDGVLSYAETLHHSPRRTIRVRPDSFTLEEERGQELIRQLEAFGCQTEELAPHLIAVDVPEENTAVSVSSFLIREKLPWEWADRN